MQKIAIIGAGITGLTIAKELETIADVKVFEKSRGLGGRMATRRTERYHFDHGAQYFVVKTPEFREFLQEPLAQGVIARWDAHFVELDASLQGLTVDNSLVSQERVWSAEFPHYVGVPTMSGLARYMAKSVNVLGNTHVAEIKRYSQAATDRSQSAADNPKWQIFSNTGDDLGLYDWVISTAPVEQTRVLLPDVFSYHTALQKIKMNACFAVMLGFEQVIDLNFQAALVRNSDISWIAVNSHKPDRPETFSILIQSSNEWAEENADIDLQEAKQYLMAEAEKITGVSFSNPEYSDIHRWLYANTDKQKFNVGEVYLDEVQQLAAAGDWCGNARVESAFLHGLKLSKQIKACL